MKIECELKGKNICIRNYTAADLSFVTEIWFDEENGKYMSDPTSEFVDDEYQAALDSLQDSDEAYYLIVQNANTKEALGACCVFPDSKGEVFDIGYCIHKKYWRYGLGTEMIYLLLDWIKSQGGKKVTAEVAVENRASNALLTRCGFHVEKESEFRKYHMDITFKSYVYAWEI